MTKGKNGGARPGAGRKKGGRNAKTLDKLAAREHVRQRVTAMLDPILDAQFANALGIKYLVVRQKTSGKFLRVTEAMAKAKLGKDEEIIEVWEKEPSTPAAIDLVNRAIDKPKEQEIEVKVTGDEGRIARLLAGRKRAKERKGE